MSTMVNMSRDLNPFTRIYLLTYIPMLGLLLLLYATLFGQIGGMSGNRFETNFGLVLVALLSLHVGRITARPGISDEGGSQVLWLILWWVNVLALVAAFCAMVLLSGATLLGVIATGGGLHYILLLIAPLAFLPSLIGNLD